MSALLEIEALSVEFGARRVLDGVHLTLEPDTTTVLLGPNGAGKSTLLRCTLGLRRRVGGRVRALGVDPLQADGAWRAEVGFVPDHPDAYPWMTARDLFRFLAAQTPRWSDARARELLERLRTPLDTTFHDMSRGEAAKVMLAAALTPRPRLLLLDEPFARLAPPTREEVLREFLAEAPAPGGAVLLATHDLDVAARAADRVLLIDAGRVRHDLDVSRIEARASLTERLRALYPSTMPDEVIA